jgi:hypothetical protein
MSNSLPSPALHRLSFTLGCFLNNYLASRKIPFYKDFKELLSFRYAMEKLMFH